jgi:transposase
MDATLLDLPSNTPEMPVCCTNCAALQRLERELAALRAEFRWEVGYWKSRHADAVKRIEHLKGELNESRGQVRAVRDKLFGRKSEKSAQSDRCNDLCDPEDVGAPPKKRGAQPGHAGHGRRDYSHLRVEEEFIALPEESLACPHCGKPVAMMSATEDSELLEVEVRAHRRRFRRRRYRATCDCDPGRRTFMAPPPPKLIPKGNYGVSIWVHVLLDKYASYRPTERLLGQLAQYDLARSTTDCGGSSRCCVRSTRRCLRGTGSANSIRPTKPVGWFSCFWRGTKPMDGGCGSFSAWTRWSICSIPAVPQGAGKPPGALGGTCAVRR